MAKSIEALQLCSIEASKHQSIQALNDARNHQNSSAMVAHSIISHDPCEI